MTALALVGLISLVFRYRAAGLDEREQLKWFVLAASFLVLALAADNVTDGIAVDWAVLVAQVALYAALAVAILKYRLYDIDILINRTLVYLPLTGILAGLYVLMTSLGRTLFTDLTGSGSDAVVAISTLSVVALLTPLKNKLQTLVDKQFKEQRQPMQGLKQLGAETRAVTRILDTERFVPAVLEQLQTALTATGAALELDAPDSSSFSVGDSSEATPASAPVLSGDRQLGRVLVWPPATGWRDERLVQPALDEAAATLAEVLSLQSRTREAEPASGSLDAISR